MRDVSAVRAMCGRQSPANPEPLQVYPTISTLYCKIHARLIPLFSPTAPPSAAFVLVHFAPRTRPSLSMSTDAKKASAASRERFLSIWPGIRDELVAYMEGEKMPAEATKWFKDVSAPSPRFMLQLLLAA